ncbi:hypothetical protein [Tunicatimonas pelagia]|uniref:hypothetical protein n=1 Tax=Tunicatimonas pelagia TaxID=931531 RepID=UPI002665ACEB|nr:hypothetical protein [Tunicatimonas pelagia]WKN41313.1 hypothetical protein P0M28_19955 [Tunicatimonas pelagia]
MKEITYLLLTFFVLVMACEENEELPGLQTVGTSTATVVEYSLSNDEPQPGENVTLSINYVNPVDDPATQIEILEQIGNGDFTALTQLDESSANSGSEVSRTVSYTVPALDSGTVVTLDMLLRTQREFPQRERVELTVQ